MIGVFLPQVDELKYLGVLFTSKGRMEREIDRRIGAAFAVMQGKARQGKFIYIAHFIHSGNSKCFT